MGLSIPIHRYSRLTCGFIQTVIHYQRHFWTLCQKQHILSSKQIQIFVPVVPPRDLKIDHLEETFFTLHQSKAEGMEKVPQDFFISNCIPGTDPLAANTDDCHKTFSNLQPGTKYTVSVTTVLSNGEQSEPVSTTICTSKKYSPNYSSSSHYQ